MFNDLESKKAYELTEDELAYLLARKLGVQDTIDTEYEKKIFADLKNTDGLVQYLRETAAHDKDRYFSCVSQSERDMVRGAFARTLHFKAMIVRSGEPAAKATKVEGVKYG